MQIRGCEIRCSALFLLVAAVAGLSDNLMVFATYMAALVLHECAHAVMASALGCKVYSLELQPYGCEARMSERADSFDELMIALSGPLCSAIAAMACTAFEFEGYFLEANLYIAAVNILPAYPLDGGRAARAVLSIAGVCIKRWTERVMAILTAAGIAAVGVAAASITMLIFAVFLFASSLQLHKEARPAYDLLRKRIAVQDGRKLAVKHVAMSADTTLKNALLSVQWEKYTVIYVLDESMCRIGELDVSALYAAAARLGSNAKIREALH